MHFLVNVISSLLVFIGASVIGGCMVGATLVMFEARKYQKEGIKSNEQI